MEDDRRSDDPRAGGNFRYKGAVSDVLRGIHVQTLATVFNLQRRYDECEARGRICTEAVP